MTNFHHLIIAQHICKSLAGKKVCIRKTFKPVNNKWGGVGSIIEALKWVAKSKFISII